MKTISRYIMTLALLITAVTGAWADAAYYVVGNFTDWSANPAYKMTLNTECTSTTEYMLTLDLPANAQFKVAKDEGGVLSTWYPDGMGNAYGENGELPGAGNYTVYFRPNGDGNQDWFYSVMYVAPAPGTVTLNDTKTEASFEMPTYDVNVSYTIKRDMTVDVTATIDDRIRIKKDGNDYQPVGKEGDIDASAALPTVTDNLDAENPVNMTEGTDKDYTLTLQKQGDTEDDWTDVTAYSVGNFRYKITGAGNYSGVIYTDPFELFEGYEIKVAAGEYATYYKDEALKVEDQEVELLTITAVESGKAVLSDASVAMNSNTPFLVHNNGTEEKTILLIPCNEPNLAVTVAKEFKGTEGPRDFSEAEMAEGDFYVCNGKEFVKVRGKGTLAANKAFLFVEGNNTPASIPFRRSIGGEGEGTTGVDAIDNAANNDANATWYDLNGRRLQGKPAQKGIYIKNGKKIVVK